MFDFDTLYRQYTTSELLRIVQQPSLFQPAAIEAAHKILAEREVSAAEHAAVADAIAEEQRLPALPGKITLMQQRAVQCIRYLFTPAEQFDAQKWLYWLCIGFVIHYMVHVFNTFNWVWYTFKRSSVDAYTVITLFTWVYIPLMTTWLLQRRKNGWLLAAFYTGIEAIGLVVASINSLKYMQYAAVSQIFLTTAYVTACMFLRTAAVRELFGGTPKEWGQAIVAAVFVCGIIGFVIVF